MAKKLIDILEDVTEAVHNAYFVDLFVRVSNAAAITMYNKVCQTSFFQRQSQFHNIQAIISTLQNH